MKYFSIFQWLLNIFLSLFNESSDTSQIWISSYVFLLELFVSLWSIQCRQSGAIKPLKQGHNRYENNKPALLPLRIRKAANRKVASLRPEPTKSAASASKSTSSFFFKMPKRTSSTMEMMANRQHVTNLATMKNAQGTKHFVLTKFDHTSKGERSQRKAHGR